MDPANAGTIMQAVGNIFGTEVTKFLKNEQALQATLLKVNEAANQTVKQAKGL